MLLQMAVSLKMLKDKYELNLMLEDYSKRINDLRECLNLPELKKNIESLEEKSNASDFWDDNKEASKVLKKLGTLKNELNNINSLASLLNDFKELLEMGEDDEIMEMIDQTSKEITSLLEKMELEILREGRF